jgi:dTMP kinase
VPYNITNFVDTMPTSGLFITFEGIDGAGKSSHIEALANNFRQQKRVVTLTREPGGTPLAEKLRALLLHDAMDPLTEALLMFAARRDHLQQVIEPALAQGNVVLCDRFTDATFAYQGHGRGFDLGILAQLEQWVQTSPSGLRQPDLTLWFDLPPRVAAERLAQARVPDKFEAQPLAFFEQVAQGYAARMQKAPQRFARIQAHASLEEVWRQVLFTCHQRGWLA